MGQFAFEREIATATERGLRWLVESFRVNGYEGSSAWSSRLLHPVHGWSLPYPETTGYIIPTLYAGRARYTQLAGEFRRCIDGSVKWLLAMQMPSGAFPGGHQVRDGVHRLALKDYLLHREHPAQESFFNSAQIVRGLVEHYRQTRDPEIRTRLDRCRTYMTQAIGDGGRILRDAYAGESSPAYFAYALAPVLDLDNELGTDAEARARVTAALDAIIADRNGDTAFIRRMGFGGVDTALTHTVAYTLQGLLEAARHIGAEGKRFRDAAEKALARIFRIAELHKKLPGAFGPDWSPIWSYVCVTGNCQLGLSFLEVWRMNTDSRYLNAAGRFFTQALATQRRDGALPGSWPIWGRYMALRWPNWAVKYFVDFGFELGDALGSEARLAS